MWLWLGVIVFGGLWYVLNRESKGSGGGGRRGSGSGAGGGKYTVLRLINFALFVLFGFSLLLASLGSWGNLATVLSWPLRSVLGWFGQSVFQGLAGSDLAFALAIPLLVAIGIDLWGRKPDKIARFGLMVLVPLCLVAGGPLGDLVISLAESLTGTSSQMLHQLASG